MKQPIVITVPGSNSTVHLEILRRFGIETIEVRNLTEAQKFYKSATHLLLQGGVDIEPKWYRGDYNGYLTRLDPTRDEVEYALAYNARKHSKPILGICRGHQMVGAVWGASLWQDLRTEAGTQHPKYHHVELKPKSALRRLFKEKEIVVNSFHHQAIFKAPRGLRVSAIAADNIIEAMEGERVLSVQWHPESLAQRHWEKIYGYWLGMVSRKQEREAEK